MIIKLKAVDKRVLVLPQKKIIEPASIPHSPDGATYLSPPIAMRHSPTLRGTGGTSTMMLFMSSLNWIMFARNQFVFRIASGSEWPEGAFVKIHLNISGEGFLP